MSIQVHVVSKLNNSKHAVFNIERPSTGPACPTSSVRVQPLLFALTSNNLSYARGGKTLHWWDAFPVPDGSPEEFKDEEKWGVVPAWGYGRVLESNIEAITKESLLWGFWPVSSHPFQIQLEPIKPDGNWRATDQHRSKLMSIYNRYEQVIPGDLDRMKMTALCKPLWMGPYSLNRGVFAPEGIHPLGAGGTWAEGDSDLTSAAVIVLSASSKTGRSFSWELAKNRDLAAQGPLALLQLTSAPDTLPSFPCTDLPIKAARYGDQDAITWVAIIHPKRIVIVDFGASDEVVQSLHASASSLCPNAVTIIAVGFEAKVYSPEELQSRISQNKSLGKVQLNASELRDRLIERDGTEQYFEEQNKAWDCFYQEKGYGAIDVRTLTAVEGKNGIEGAWDDLCTRSVNPSVGIIVDLSKGALG